MKTSSIRDVLSLGFLNRRETVIISGSINSNTNALARALGMKAEREGASVMTVNAGILDEGLEEDGKEGPSAVKAASVAKPKLLIIENFGMKRLAPSQTKVLAQLVAERINRASIIITSWYPLEAWAPLVGASAIGKSLLGSLSIHARQVVIGTEDQPVKKKPAPAEAAVQAHA